MNDNERGYIVTHHSLGGSYAEAARPSMAWHFDSFEEARAFAEKSWDIIRSIDEYAEASFSITPLAEPLPHNIVDDEEKMKEILADVLPEDEEDYYE